MPKKLFQKGNPGGPGEPTKYTPERHAQIVEDLRRGAWREHACLHAGVTTFSFYRWLKKAELGIEPYVKFAEDVAQAEAEAIVQATGDVHRAGKLDWKAAIAWLERKDPQKFGARVRFEVQTHMTVFLDQCAAELPPEWYERVLQIAARADSASPPQLVEAETP